MSESRPAAGHPTIYDVAKAAGVSKSLVSLVLQGSPRVSEARRTAVEAAIEELQYRPSQAAASLAAHRTRTIGVVLDDYRNLWFIELLDGMQDELAPLGFRVAVAAGTVNAHVDPTPFDGFRSLRVDGIVVASEPDEATQATGIPIVVAGSRAVEIPGADVVANDDRVGGRMATDHLIGLGHTEIGHVSGPGGAATLRSEGYADAMRAAGLAVRIDPGGAGTTEVDGYDGGSRILRDRPATTAIFAANDTMAMGVAAAARDRGRRIPEDLSLIGYDNSPLASAHLLELTTVDARSFQVGAQSARALMSRIADPGLPSRTTLLEPRLVVRSSTGPVPN